MDEEEGCGGVEADGDAQLMRSSGGGDTCGVRRAWVSRGFGREGKKRDENGGAGDGQGVARSAS